MRLARLVGLAQGNNIYFGITPVKFKLESPMFTCPAFPQNIRTMKIQQVYFPSFLVSKRVLVCGDLCLKVIICGVRANLKFRLKCA
jgi:hypothetical protein